jgi:hypothetical protein
MFAQAGFEPWSSRSLPLKSSWDSRCESLAPASLLFSYWGFNCLYFPWRRVLGGSRGNACIEGAIFKQKFHLVLS